MNHPKVIFTIVCCIFINIRSCIRARGKADRADGQREQLKINKERERTKGERWRKHQQTDNGQREPQKMSKEIDRSEKKKEND